MPDTADAGAQGGLERLALGHRLDGVEDLDVAGAPAQVGAEVRRHRGPVEVGALLVDLRLGPHHDAGDAEPALQPAAGREGVGVAPALVGVDALQRDDVLAGHLVEPEVAAHDRLAVDEHRAAPALPRRRAAVLGRRDVELLAQRGQQVRVVVAHRHRRPVEGELHVYILSKSRRPVGRYQTIRAGSGGQNGGYGGQPAGGRGPGGFTGRRRGRGAPRVRAGIGVGLVGRGPRRLGPGGVPRGRVRRGDRAVGAGLRHLSPADFFDPTNVGRLLAA